jgi:hypothetical protein
VRAAALIAEVQQGNRPIDEETSLDIISAQAFVAAAQNNQSALHDSVREGFASSNRMLLEQQGAGRNYLSIRALSPLVHIGMEHDPDFTIPFVEGLPASRLKAELLMSRRRRCRQVDHRLSVPTHNKQRKSPIRD